MQTTTLFDINGDIFANALRSGIYKVIKSQENLNLINVFPVADADTGTNLCLSLGPLINIIESKENHHLSTLLSELADKLLDNSRGNSGSIIAQFFQGISECSANKSKMSPIDFSKSINLGSKYANDALSKPIEGTIITVISVFAKAMSDEIKKNPDNDFHSIYRAVLPLVKIAVTDTKNQMDVLKKANVVDAGAKGFYLLIKGFINHITLNEIEPKPEVSLNSYIETDNLFNEASSQTGFQYCTECIINGKNIDRRKLRESLSEHGDSIVIAGTKQKAKIHIHTDQPNTIFEVVKHYGKITSEKADDMHLQHKITKKDASKFAVITDSAADIHDEDIEKLDIHIVPIRIQFGEKGYLDKVSITPNEFFEELNTNPIHPTTSQPSMGDLRRQYQYLASHFEDVISINVTNKLSGTYDAAKLASKKITASGKIHVFNSLNASLGQGQIAVAAAQCAKAGMNILETLTALKKIRTNTKTYAIISNLKYAVRGGRVPNSIKFIAEKLRLTPILQTTPDGNLKTKNFLFGRTGILRKFSKFISKHHNKDKKITISIGHACTLENAKLLKSYLMLDLPKTTECKITEIGSAIGVHGGPGAIVVGIQIQSD
jgi:DegV family protein with EDD domain